MAQWLLGRGGDVSRSPAGGGRALFCWYCVRSSTLPPHSPIWVVFPNPNDYSHLGGPPRVMPAIVPTLGQRRRGSGVEVITFPITHHCSRRNGSALYARWSMLGRTHEMFGSSVHQRGARSRTRRADPGRRLVWLFKPWGTSSISVNASFRRPELMNLPPLKVNTAASAPSAQCPAAAAESGMKPHWVRFGDGYARSSLLKALSSGPLLGAIDPCPAPVADRGRAHRQNLGLPGPITPEQTMPP